MGIFGGKHDKPKKTLQGGAIPKRKQATPKKTVNKGAQPKKPWWKR